MGYQNGNSDRYDAAQKKRQEDLRKKKAQLAAKEAEHSKQWDIVDRAEEAVREARSSWGELYREAERVKILAKDSIGGSMKYEVEKTQREAAEAQEVMRAKVTAKNKEIEKADSIADEADAIEREIEELEEEEFQRKRVRTKHSLN